MPDPRFYGSGPALTGPELVAFCSAEAVTVQGDTRFSAVGSLATAGPGEVAFLADRRYRQALSESRAGAVIVAAAHAALVPAGALALVVPDPQATWSRLARHLHPPRLSRQTVQVDPTARLEAGVFVGLGAVVGPGVEIGQDSWIGPNAVLGPGVTLGRRCTIGPGAVLGFCHVGDDVQIGPGTVIGQAGFGVAAGRQGLEDVHQMGRVIIQDHVSIGANACIDRGALEDTVVGERTKIDNGVQIGHNTRIGRNVVLAGHVGISGSVVIDDGAQLGGRAGATDHVRIGKGVKLAAAAWTMQDIPDGEVWGGAPAKPLRRFLRETLWLAKQAKGRDGEG